MARRERNRAATATTHKLCSLLLQYPDQELLDARAELSTAVQELPGTPARGALQRFCAWWGSEDPLALQQHYVETFDLDKRCGLYLGFYGEGDRRERGSALLRLKRLYRAAGLPLEGTELPDYLPVMLEFAAAAPSGRGSIVLREHRAALELVRASLRERQTRVRRRARSDLLDRRRDLGRRSRAGGQARRERPAPRARRPGAVRASRGHAERGGETMSAGKILLWIIIPYVAITVFVVGHWWRYRRDQFEWTSRSTQLLDRRILGWASPMFHYGALAAVGGHLIGLCIPRSWTDAIGISEYTYHWIAAIAGGIAGLVTLIGFLGLVYRRITSDRVRRNTTRVDLLTYLLLTVLIGLGCWMTFAHNLLTHAPYNYRVSIGVWWRSLFDLQPNVAAASRRSTGLSAARDHRLAVLGIVPLQPTRARLEHPDPVHRAPLHPVPPPVPDRPVSPRSA